MSDVKTIETKSNARTVKAEVKNSEGKVISPAITARAARSIETIQPDVISMTDLKSLQAALGEARCVNYITAQLTIAFRSHVRGKLEAQNDDGTIKNSDADIKTAITADWKPEERVRKTAEDKALEALGVLSPEEIKAVMKAMKAKK